jgi:uncharacterized protein (TIGR03435 family)
MTHAASLVFGLFAIASAGGGLSAQACSKFDVASIKLNTSGAGGGYPELTPGSRRFVATNQLMVELLMSAYDVPPLQILGIPGAFSQDRYDVYATCEQPITKEQLPHLLQSLLAERFQLSIHRESREQTVYALVSGKSGARLHESSPEGGKPTLRQSGYNFTFTNADMSKLVSVLSQLAGRKVVDATGLRGRYDFTLSYAPDRGEDREGSNIAPAVERAPDSVLTAVREQLGLNLEAQKSQVEFIVVDRIERLIPN